MLGGDAFYACPGAVADEYWENPDRRGYGGVIVLSAPAEDGTVGLAGCGDPSQPAFPDNSRSVSVAVSNDLEWDPGTLAHELGHALCWPHSGSRPAGYDNPLDLMG